MSTHIHHKPVFRSISHGASVLFRMLRQYAIESVDQLSSIPPKAATGNTYYNHQQNYIIHSPLEKVWQSYVSIRPEDAWNSKLIRFICMHPRKSSLLYTSMEPISNHTLQQNQLYFFELRIFFGWYKICIGTEVTEVSAEQKQFSAVYLDNSITSGKQTISLIQIDEESTLVKHETRYQSGHWFRDRILYPYFHTKTISVLHNRVKQRVEVS